MTIYACNVFKFHFPVQQWPHIARTVYKWLEMHEEDITALSCSLNSSYLYPIEHLYYHLDRVIGSLNNYLSSPELSTEMHLVWLNIPVSTF